MRMRIRTVTIRLLCLTFLALLAQFAANPRQAHAVVPYPTLSINADGDFIKAPNAFVPGPVWRGFSDPEDLFIAQDGGIYVADTGNDRIVQLNGKGEFVRTIPASAAEGKDAKQAKDGKDTLRGPEGVFVDKDGTVYVADTKNRRIAVFDKAGTFEREIKSPATDLLPKTYTYVPSKVVIDKRGFMYLVNKGGYQGLLQLSPEGEFMGFFGANKVKTDWLTALKRKYFTEEQLKKEQQDLPGTIGNVTVDRNGFLYTVNARLSNGQLKRLNFAGDDLLGGKNFAWWIAPQEVEQFAFADVSVDDDGIMTLLQRQNGQIYQYDTNGKLIFRIGLDGVGSQRLGLFKSPTSIATLQDGTILVADSEQNMIQTFKRSHFGDLMHDAITAYNDGRYEESEGTWSEILKIDALFDRAYLGIAKRDLQEGRFDEAAEHFKIASNKQGYSDAFWEIRMKWLFKYFGWIMLGVVALLAAASALSIAKRFRKKKKAALQQILASGDEDLGRMRFGAGGDDAPKRAVPESGIDPFTGLIRSKTNNRWLISVQRTFSLLKHPVGTMNDIVEKEQVRFWYAFILMAAGLLVSIFGKAIISYLFSSGEFVDLNLKNEALYYLLPWFTWVLANYLIGSIMKGEGTFAKVFIVNAYAMVPAILFTLPLAAFSNLLTLDEGVIYNFLHLVIRIWVVALMFLGTQTVHNYNMKESLKMIAVSLLTFGCLWVFGFVLVGLMYMTADFFTGLGRELLNRV
ncbi:YIP1 family protein [Paenibacillus sacheonensis]|uniref:DUF1282 domain-containing protein n=1 Tax=Paenibacillus sacheonensis TaxID=742054 RepID=A0A7X4YT73_9BACL|nr:YIP1 family protein [Paenibacillus sacheonensis]MBM7568373.1 hypothetical protein [Paenibacillus sacheonensis]NBC72073.1 DUF1282 domain-containing protein [Paenibacillus sacheonensis]